jgi:hypothetical protein
MNETRSLSASAALSPCWWSPALGARLLVGAVPAPIATGRPTKRTPETEEAIFAALRKGMTKKAAAASGGITYTTLREWETTFLSLLRR